MVNNYSIEVSRVFDALSDPTRRAILDQLVGGESRVKELAAPYAVSLPAISKHLRILEQAGLIARRPAGRETICSLKIESMQQAAEWMDRYRLFWSDRLDSLERYLESSREENI